MAESSSAVLGCDPLCANERRDRWVQPRMEWKRRGGDKAAWPNRCVHLLFGTSSTTTTTIVATWHVVHVLSHSLVIVHILLPSQQWQQVTQAKLLQLSESTTAMATLIFICLMLYQDCLFKLEH
ncbi:hypothetical protein QYF36_001444 [Acer negundo]|nr:hypothetical protein QYF36_001444 [Acer negundo]